MIAPAEANLEGVAARVMAGESQMIKLESLEAPPLAQESQVAASLANGLELHARLKSRAERSR